MGGSGSKLEKTLGESFPEGERIFGLENFGNTCYCNSILQALYFCMPFRKKILQYHKEREKTRKLPSAGPKLMLAPDTDNDENLMTCLGDLFEQIGSQKKRSGSLAPKKFVQRLRKDNELFRSHMHQDAQEFLNYLLNELADILEKESQKDAPLAAQQNGITTKPEMESLGFEENEEDSDLDKTENIHGEEDETAEEEEQQKPKTWVHDIFEGVLENKTRCLRCENVTSRDECFLDLSLDIMQNSSVSFCLRSFELIEMMAGDEKFYCDSCSSLQEAQRWMRIKKAPQVLALHLKRFKFIESLGRHKKLSYRVVFPQELRLNRSVDEGMYDLFAVVVHVGSGPNHGHYICLVRSHDRWLTFDDDDVRLLEDGQLQQFFGSTSDVTPTNEHGYMLFYMRREEKQAEMEFVRTSFASEANGQMNSETPSTPNIGKLYATT